MQGSVRQKLVVLATIGVFVLGIEMHGVPVYAASTDTSALQTQIDANNDQVNQLNQEIATYQAKLKEIGSDKKTLQAAIDSLDLQRKTVEARISATQHIIDTTRLRIDQLNIGIASTSKEIAIEQAALSRDFQNLQKLDGQPLVVQLLSSKDITAFWQDVGAFSQFSEAMQAGVITLRSKQADLTTSQNAAQTQNSNLVHQRNALSTQQTTLTQTKQSKAQLLVETDSKESTYQSLLTKAKAELASFSTFAQNAGGSGLLTNQTTCDSWGCYYNQRDSAWGNSPLNGTEYKMKSDGCLVTALAMVLTHYGMKNVTPVTINANPANFATYYPAYLLQAVNVDGKTVTRVSSTIDSVLATGNPVIVGLHAYGGTHFVVLVSGSKGNYLMRDPYVANAVDIPFTSHYSVSAIYEVNKVTIS